MDVAESRLLSNLGWVDHGSIWTLDIESREVAVVPAGDGEYVRLHRGARDYFAAAVMRTSGKEWMTLTVRVASAPADVLARWEVGMTHAEGSPEDWRRVPRHFVGWDPERQTYVLVSVDAESREVAIDRLEWFDESYDWGYQQPITVCAVPGSRRLLFSVQRSSDLILYDHETRRVERKIPLASRRFGNPEPVFRASAPELWAVDYDTLVRLDARTWDLTDAIQLQSAADGTMQFVGEFAFDASEHRCAVARPYSGDVVVVDTGSFAPVGSVDVGKRPLDVALLTDGRVFARDWKTGELVTGRLQQTRTHG